MTGFVLQGHIYVFRVNNHGSHVSAYWQMMFVCFFFTWDVTVVLNKQQNLFYRKQLPCFCYARCIAIIDLLRWLARLVPLRLRNILKMWKARSRCSAHKHSKHRRTRLYPPESGGYGSSGEGTTGIKGLRSGARQRSSLALRRRPRTDAPRA